MFFLAIGSIVSIFFISKTDFKSLLYINQGLSETTAKIINIKETNCSTNDNKILQYTYRFLEYDKAQHGISYSYDSPIKADDTVQIEFVQDNINVSRIVGMTSAPYDLYVGGFVLLFPLLGLGFIAADLKKLNQYIFILKDFSLTTGDLESKEKTTTEINDSPLYKMTYIYEDHEKNTSILLIH